VKILVYTVAGVAAFLAILKILVLILEPRLTFFPFHRIDMIPADLGIPYEEHFIDTPDGARLWAWHLPCDQPVAELLFFHGNAGNLSKGRLELLADLQRHGFTVFVFDYRGYGKSTGSPTEKGVLADAAAATDYFWARIHRPGRAVIYHGRSIGGLTAAYAAGHRETDGLILEATFPDKKTLLQHYPFMLRFLGLFSRYELATAEYLREVSCPILMIHGDRDRIVPFPVGQDLYRRLETADKRFLVIPGADHNDQATTGGELYWPGILEFASRIQGHSQPEISGNGLR